MFALKNIGSGRITSALCALAIIIVGCSGGRFWGEKDSAAAEVAPDQPSSEALATGIPELPRVYIDTIYVPPSGGRTINVAADGNLQEAINSAQPGDIIALQAGATFRGTINLPKKTGDQWIVIRTSTPDNALPPPGTRVTPAQSNLMPKIVSDAGDAALVALNGAHHYRFIGVEFALAPGVQRCFNLIALGTDDMKTVADLPHNLIFDRVYVHGNTTGNLRRGIMLNSGATAIIDSWIDEVHEVGADSQGIAGWSGTGPYKIVNNHIEGAAENVLFGGATPQINGTVPSDIEFRRNYLFKPLKWKATDPSFAGINWVVKNLFELKNARRVLMEGNVLDHNWLSGQQGNCILFTVRTEGGNAPWAVVNDVTVINNVIRNVAGAFELSGLDNLAPATASGESRRILIKNNLLEEINGPKWDANNNGVFLKIAAAAEVTVDHNTVINTGNTTTAHSYPSPGFTFTNNLIAHNEYGMIGDARTPGFESINHFFPNFTIKRNVIAGADSKDYPTDNFYPPNLNTVKFVDMASGNYRLAEDSPYRNQATDGSDLGANFDALSDRFLATSVSAASYQSAKLAPEMISAVFGGRLATSTLVATEIPLPTTLGGTSVRFRDSSGTERSSPLFFVSPTQINFQIPPATVPGPAAVTVFTGNGIISQGMTQVADVAPGVFSIDASGRGLPTGQVLRVRGDIQTYETIARFDQAQNKFVSVPIDMGPPDDQVYLILFCTGVRFRSQLSAVSVKVGGVDSQVIFAGATPGLVGLDQINLLLPRSLAGRGDVTLDLMVDGQTGNQMQVNIK